ncbi:MAG: AAA family ATPase [Planctomycetaceae bacterium]|nr:AAA family ATPase [Planctomycetaceae bacterium]
MPPADRDEQSLHALQQALQDKIGTRRYRQWFGGNARFAIERDTLLVQVASPYLLNWIERNYRTTLKDLCTVHFGPQVRVVTSVASGDAIRDTPPADVAAADGVVTLSEVPADVVAETVPLPSVARSTARDPKTRGRRLSRLSDFVTGPCNELAFAAARQVIDQPDDLSTVFIQANIGNGKTHLLEAIQYELRRAGAGSQTLLMTADQFTSYFMQAMSTRTTPSFRARFHGIDVLLLDDIDFLENKKGTQDELLQIMKRLEQQGGQVIVTSNRHPRLLTRMSEELVSRFQAGLVCRVESPSESVRREIVQRHATRQRVTLSTGAVNFIVDRFSRNVRELEGAVNVLAVWSRMQQRKIGTTNAREVLGRLERDCLKIIRLTDVEQVVCETFGLAQQDLRGTSKKQSITRPRMLAMYLARRLASLPYSEIGEHFGKRNHSTVMSAERRISRDLETGTFVKLGGEQVPLKELLLTLEDRIKAV